jgi:[ribosomal protein S5]-alanine N-acetyltransferase
MRRAALAKTNLPRARRMTNDENTLTRPQALNPHPIMLRTERLVLADLTLEDLHHTYAMDRDPLVMRYIGDGKPEARPFDEYSEFFRGRIGLWLSERFHVWSMREHGQDKFLGWAMLKPIKDTLHVEVGYRMPQTSWGKGYATEATQAILAFAFDDLKLEEVIAVTHPDNAASQHVLQKCGLVRDGTLNYNNGGEIPFFRLTATRYRALREGTVHGN